jgi:hypothetical protein
MVERLRAQSYEKFFASWLEHHRFEQFRAEKQSVRMAGQLLEIAIQSIENHPMPCDVSRSAGGI